MTLLELPLLRRGKVRDVYDLGDRVLLVATDRISAFDVVLPTAIPGKGVVLTQLSAFWFGATRHVVGNHLVATSVEELPAVLAPHREALRGRAMLGWKARRIDVECVARGYLAGSAWAEYRRAGTIGGRPARSGLRESEELPEPLFTPTTKAESGHDQPMSFGEVEALVGAELAGRLRDATLAVYGWARAYAHGRGILIADTKLEFGLVDGELILIDELLTPDSSRFWPADRYAPGRPQPSFDKQFVRDYLASTGWDKQPPAPELPPDVVAGTAARYREAYRRLVGRELEA
ncbi:MAG TPA: phosphoribosylaminoimidazolesuccinocarboxamide synthase [Chloroflexota bacterium]|nr:phosphoribosylaminoimidazolesuccinocarboxamide synthase [Chloroflexota bacterium]